MLASHVDARGPTTVCGRVTRTSIVENQGFSSVAGVDCAPPNAGILMANCAAVMVDQIPIPVHVASQGKCQANDDQRDQAEPDSALKSGTCQLPHARLVRDWRENYSATRLLATCH